MVKPHIAAIIDDVLYHLQFYSIQIHMYLYEQAKPYITCDFLFLQNRL